LNDLSVLHPAASQPVVRHRKDLYAPIGKDIATLSSREVERGLHPALFHLLQDEHPGLLEAKTAILRELNRFTHPGNSPVGIMVWDGGDNLDFADDLLTLFHSQAAATVLEPDKRYLDYYHTHLKNTLNPKIRASHADIRSHQFDGRYDVMVSLFTVNRLTPTELRQVLNKVKQHGLQPDGLLLMAGQFIDNYGSRAALARYYANVLFHCIVNHNLTAAQGVLADWYQLDNRQDTTVMRSDRFEKILTDCGFRFLRYKLWPEVPLSQHLPMTSENSGVYLYKAWLKHDDAPAETDKLRGLSLNA
jgi:hypothetical protein